eukprot:170401-Chlamydomonas_euryale.AAC.2
MQTQIDQLRPAPAGDATGHDAMQAGPVPRADSTIGIGGSFVAGAGVDADLAAGGGEAAPIRSPESGPSRRTAAAPSGGTGGMHDADAAAAAEQPAAVASLGPRLLRGAAGGRGGARTRGAARGAFARWGRAAK